MRLTCPNCDAQYEVPDEVVPVEGRDVQCSNCGQTWFQHHVDHVPEDAEEDDDVLPDAPGPEPEEISPPPAPVAAPPEPEQPALPERKQLDPEVADILRQEAEAETVARRQRQSEPLESQPDLGLTQVDELDEAERRAFEARKRMARMRGEPEPVSEADTAAAAISSRRDLLPDIEEINSTLRNDDDRAENGESDVHLDGPTTKKRKRGFRRGLVMVLLLFVFLAALYIYAPQIAQAVPQVDPYLSAYVSSVDQARLWLDGQVQGIARWLDTKASQSGS